MSDDKLDGTSRVMLGVGGAVGVGTSLFMSAITFGLFGATGSTQKSVSMLKAAISGDKKDLGPDDGLRDTSDNY